MVFIIKTQILLLEPDKVKRDALSGLLKSHQYEVIHADEAVSNCSPSLILISAHAERSVIKDLLNRFNANRLCPILLLLETQQLGSLDTWLDFGVDDCLTYPLLEPLVLIKVSSLIEFYRTQHRLESSNQSIQDLHQKLELEHRSAERIFDQFVRGPSQDVVGVTTHISAASVFNGDLFLSAISPAGNVIVLLGDFTGHGLPAAIGAVPVAEVFYAMVKKGRTIAQIIRVINDKLSAVLPVHMFFGCLLIQICPRTSKARLFNCGMQPVLMLKDQGRAVDYFHSPNLPLGILKSGQLELNPHVISLKGDEIFLLHSDGLVEAFGLDGKTQFGLENVEKAWLAGQGSLKVMIDALAAFTGPKILADDLSLVAIHIPSIFAGSTNLKSQAMQNNFHPSSDWQFSLTFSATNLQHSATLVEGVVDMMMQLQPLYVVKEHWYLIIEEMFNNALEHGVLGLQSSLKQQQGGFLIYHQEKQAALAELESGWIRIDIEHKAQGTLAGLLSVCVTDSGQGFDPMDAKFGQLPEGTQQYGRGGYLLKSMCTKITHNAAGNQVCVEVPWDLTK